ncbi:MAG: DAK2 domain-containing protein [Clostridiales bacterium]|nr:DAK2 domain-containing protein [Clostridiales bacterium]
MSDVKISGALFRDMLFTGAALLERNKAQIDSLNVFPVPDGDTGTNMTMTMQSAVKEIKSANCATVTCVSDALSLGALKGARGNSGVILSQIFRGFSRALKDAEDMDAAMLYEAVKTGTEAAYKAVMKPKEGTMLTVSRMISEALEEELARGANVYNMIDVMVEAGEKALILTPELLPVLKEAGVVDSGGKGLVTIFRGFKMAIDGEEIGDKEEMQRIMEAPARDVLSLTEVFDIRFPYCTEFFIIRLNENFKEDDLETLREKLTNIGDSLVIAYDADMVKVHVHTPSPGKALQFALRFGEIDKIKIENMREQNRAIPAKRKAAETEFALVAVTSGEGIGKVMKDLGINAIIQGGQTMNPSIEDISQAIYRVNARTVYVLPNNSNIILAAQQAAQVSECKVVVIPTKTIPQGIAAVMAFHPDLGVEENEKRMSDAISGVISGSVTYAVRDTTLNDDKIRKGDIIGLMDGKIVTVSGAPQETSLKLLRIMMEKKAEDDCIVTIFYGESMQEAVAQELVDTLQPEYPDVEFVIENGGQPIYYYFFSVE